MHVPSSDDVQVRLHDLGGDGPPLLLSHATGFHGHCYVPMAEVLSDRFHAWALDYRGHGHTPAPPDWEVRWEGYGDDAAVAADAVAPEGGLVAFGHSMGGACLLMAAHRDPRRFRVIVAFEPIVFPPPAPGEDRAGNALAEGARRRRDRFESVQHAIDNYASKPPLGAFTPEALRWYVEHGTEPVPDAEGGGVRLRCAPEHEARTFEMGGTHGTWDLLPEITTPVVVVAGRVDPPMGPAVVAASIAERLPNARYVQLDHLDHFGPMTHPDQIAELVADAADDHTSAR